MTERELPPDATTGREPSPRQRAVARRQRTWTLLVVGVAIVEVPALAVAWWNPWRYVYLMPIGRLTLVVAAVMATPVLLAAAGWLVLRDRVSQVALSVTASAMAVTLAYLGIKVTVMAKMFGGAPSGPPTVAAVSSSGSHEIVVLKYKVFIDSRTVVRIRARAGLLSRESARDVACFYEPFSDKADATFGSARFIGPHEVEVRTEDGDVWTSTFDPKTLRPASTLDWC